MHATTTHFAIRFLPDWNSLESVRRAHSDLEAIALVFFALLVVFEALAHLTEDQPKERLFNKIGVFLFAVAVLGEIVAYPYGQRNDTLSGNVISYLDARANDASNRASKALTDSGTAITQAGEAETESGSAVTSASTALTTARGARSEADSFEKDIQSAEKEAADADSNLAEALREVAGEKDEVNRLKTPRSLTNSSGLEDSLRAFKGTEYAFTGVFQDQDSIDLLRAINNTLTAAGWKRINLPNTQPGEIEVTLNGFKVPVTTRSGVWIEAESTEKIEDLRSLPPFLFPRYISGGMALKGALFSSIFPQQENLKSAFGVNLGPSKAVAILVGKKL